MNIRFSLKQPFSDYKKTTFKIVWYNLCSLLSTSITVKEELTLTFLKEGK